MTFDTINPLLLALLLGLTLLVTATGFRNPVHFVSLGYTFAIVILALASVVLFRASLNAWSLLHCALLAGWGLRLGFYLLRRERQPSYQGEMAAVQGSYGSPRLSRKFLIWISVSILYVLMFTPALFHAAGPVFDSPLALICQGLGVVVALGGLGIEAAADQQKSAFKRTNPGRFCDQGLYRLVRSPNYLGEILFWTGSWILGIPFFPGLGGWAAGLTGLVLIVLIMMGSTRRLEISQGRRYGQIPEYQTYIRQVPVLFPFVPLYTLQNLRIQIG